MYIWLTPRLVPAGRSDRLFAYPVSRYHAQEKEEARKAEESERRRSRALGWSKRRKGTNCATFAGRAPRTGT
jgi:hypothetical protein